MTEAEWLACTEPSPMIQFLELGRKGTCRKLRLFGVACCRRIGHFHKDEQIGRIVEVAEGYADGLAKVAKMRAAHRRTNSLCEKGITLDSSRMDCVLANAAVAANWVSASNASFRTKDRSNSLVPGGYMAAAASYIAGSTADAAFYATYEGADAVELVRRKNVEGVSTPADSIWATEEEAQSVLLRCVFGPLPFRSVPFDSSLLVWNDGTVPKMARSIYDERAFDRLPILADALEDAGCTDRDILGHCRQPGEHVRGCWVVDLILGES
jgi:hypothetical protein